MENAYDNEWVASSVHVYKLQVIPDPQLTFKDEQLDAEMLYLLLLTSVMCTLNLELACVQKSREELVHLWICFFSLRDLYVMIHRADCPGDVIVVAAPKYISGMALRLVAWAVISWGGEKWLQFLKDKGRDRRKQKKKVLSRPCRPDSTQSALLNSWMGSMMSQISCENGHRYRVCWPFQLIRVDRLE